MKTPKRAMPKGLAEAEKYLRGTNCQFLNMKARWKRKNREKRLKHALQRQAWNAVMLAADLRCAELSARSWKKRYREIWRMQFWTTSAYGQDIEGS